MLIELRYQCYIHACFGNYLGNIFLLFFLSFLEFFVWSVWTVFWDVQTVILYVRTVILVVRTIRLIRSDVHSSCSDERVFATSTWHYVRTSLKFRLDGEPCRVKSHSPRAAAYFFASFGSFCRLVHFPCDFYAKVYSTHVIFAVYLHSRYIYVLFYYFILSFYA
jgi:hypothetical protein